MTTNEQYAQMAHDLVMIVGWAVIWLTTFGLAALFMWLAKRKRGGAKQSWTR